jgi:hypothetical protein
MPSRSTRFLSRAKPKPAPPTGYKSKRKFDGFWKVKLPAATEAYGQKSIEEILKHWDNLIDILSSIDKKIEILGWNETLNIKPHMKGSLAPTSRDQLQKYVANVLSRIGMDTWLRFRLAHDVDKDQFLDSAALEEAQLQLSYDKVQAKVTTAWGWMLGAIPKTANFQDMKEFYENHPLLKDFQIEARQQSIRLFPGRQKIPDELDVKAIYIYGDDTKTAAGRKASNRVFAAAGEKVDSRRRE